MKSCCKYLLLSIMLLGTIECAYSDNVRYLTDDEFMSLFFDTSGDRPVYSYHDTVPCIVDFYTVWCGPCKMLAPIMSELSEQYKGQVNFYKVDIDKERYVARLLGITSIPQMLFVPLSDRPQMIKGFRQKEIIEAIINEYLLGKVECGR